MVAVNSIRPIPGGAGGVGQVVSVQALPGVSGGDGTAFATVTLRSVEQSSQQLLSGPDGEGTVPPPLLSGATVTTVQAVPASTLPAAAATDSRITGEETDDPREAGGDEENADGNRTADEGSFAEEVSLAEQQVIQLLQARDGAVRVEETVQATAAGAYSGAISYTYIPGPDGRLYAVGGSVTATTAGAVSEEAQQLALDAIAAGGSAVGSTSGADRIATGLANGRLQLLSEQATDAYLQSSRFLA